MFHQFSQEAITPKSKHCNIAFHQFSSKPHESSTLTDFPALLNYFTATLNTTTTTALPFASTSDPTCSPKWLRTESLSVLERALIGAGGGDIADAFTYACLHPLDTIKTKMQTKGASELYKNTLDAVAKTFARNGIAEKQ